ncbi:PREDICTED: uncharacterized protein LOC107171339 [Diuraphis noxia]|uniref:uncharacterized protein LOC107171339 n=1 Tax=Diuraphis noxia TaxID=143948 RepID=UPI000763983D|nr:PREDICTED: uncharacterized protein LOC107171339 [Diuraphis noxia]
MAAFLQINTNRSREAQALAFHTMKVKEADVLCISEPNHIPDHLGWVGSTDRKCALFFQQNQYVLRTGSGAGYAWADLKDIRIYSCYISPNCTFNEFDVFLYRLFGSVRGATSEVIVAGDFNAHSPAWGSHKTDPRGDALLEFAESLNLVLLNDGKVPTFPRANSFLDLTLVTKGIMRKIGSWGVLEDESLSDHQYVFFNTRMPVSSVQTEKNGWSWRKLDTDRLDKFIAEAITPLSMTAEASSTVLSELLRNACNAKRFIQMGEEAMPLVVTNHCGTPEGMLTPAYEQGARTGWSTRCDFEANNREEAKASTGNTQHVPCAGALPEPMEGGQACSSPKREIGDTFGPDLWD